MSVNFWERITCQDWNLVTPPWKPSLIDILLYSIFIMRTKFLKERVLLLGATKEIRLLLAFLKCKYDLVDYSSNMVLLTKPREDTLDCFYKEDWLSIEFANKKYGLIMGDLILNLLPGEDLGKFSLKYKNLMSDMGTMLLRTRLTPKDINTKAKIKVCQTLRKSLVYTAFANLQTLNKIEPNSSRLILQEEMKKNIEPKYREKLKVLKLFLSGELNYFLHGKTDIENTIKPWKIVFMPSLQFLLDRYTFLIIKQQ